MGRHEADSPPIVISISIVIQVVFLGLTIEILLQLGSWLATPPLLFKFVFSLVLTVIWLVAGIGISVWLWSGTFLLLKIFSSLEPALYFCTVTFTTLGYGDITLDKHCRLLSSLMAVNGLIIFGLNTAFLIDLIGRLLTSLTSA